MATAPSKLATITDDSAASASIWRRIAERPYAPETLLLYSALSFFFLGRNLIGHFSDRYIGMGHDPASAMFFLEWWRYALASLINPFHLTAAWYPPGYNLALTTPIPLAALAMMPVEATLGPIAAYNVAILLCPALSAWSAFLLCRYITRSYYPSLVGGYVFGFSSYMLAHSLGHLTLTMVFLLPPAVYLVLLWFANELTDGKFVLLLTLVFLGQFLSSLEMLATMTLAGSSFLSLVWLGGNKRLRQRILKLIPLSVACVLLLSTMASPYLYYLFRDGSFPMANGMALAASADLLSSVVPVSTNVLGGWKAFRIFALAPNLWEAGEYIGIPLFLIIWDFGRSRWKNNIDRGLVVFFVITLVATFGPELKIATVNICPLPWRVITQLPLLHVILPARLSVYLFLDLAIVVAISLNNTNYFTGWRVAAAVAVLISLLPNLSASYWTVPANIPPFFAKGLFRKYLSPHETVLILPYGYWGDGDLWTAETRMYFRMAGGYVGVIPVAPPGFEQYPIVADLYNLVRVPDAETQLKAFLAQKHIGSIIVADKGEHLWRPVPNARIYTLERKEFSPEDEQIIQSLFSKLGTIPIHIGEITLYHVPLDRLRPYETISVGRLQEEVARSRIANLIIAANEYVAAGFDVKSLTPLKAQELGFLPSRWVGGIYKLPQHRMRVVQDEMVLGPSSDGAIGVGILGPREILKELAKEYGSLAIYPVKVQRGAVRMGNCWLLPPDMHSPDLIDSMEWILLMEFRPDGLAQAAKVAERALAEQAAHPLIAKSRSEDSGPKAAVSTISSAGRLR